MKYINPVVLIAIQSVLLALMAIFTGVQYEEAWQVITVILGQLQFIFKDYLKNSRGN